MTRSPTVNRLVSAGSIAAVVAVLLPQHGCADSERERLKETTRPSYDNASGRLRELTFDANKNGKVDTWTEMDGDKPLRSRIDSDEDGRPDRWEYYDADGKLAKVGFSRKSGGKPDAWAFSTPDGRIERIEVSSSADESRVDRWEFYDASAPSGSDGTGPLLRVEEDTNGNRRQDKWELFENGILHTAEFDENHDGRPDRRLTYRDGALVLIETAPDASGIYTRRVEPKE